MIYHGDCLELLRKIDKVKAIFADIPDNINQKYLGYDDQRKSEDYFDWIRLLILETLPKCKVFWLAYYPEWDLEISYIVRDILKYRHPSFEAMKFIWRYTFSQYNDFDCSYGYRPILRLKRSDCELYPDAIREISRRQELGDHRAQGKRVPDNVWSIPRVVGNSFERCDWIPNQLPLKLLERIIAFSVSKEIDKSELFLDLFGGSGSAIKAKNHLNEINKARMIESKYSVSCCDISMETCTKMQQSIIRMGGDIVPIKVVNDY